MAVGTDNVDLAAAAKLGIAVSNTPDVLTDATADLAFALLLAAARRLAWADRYVRGGGFTGWRPDVGIGLDVSGRTLGIVGAGRIGRAVAERARGFRMEVLFHSRSGGVAKDELLARSDFVSLHAPLTPETRHWIGEPELRRDAPARGAREHGARRARRRGRAGARAARGLDRRRGPRRVRARARARRRASSTCPTSCSRRTSAARPSRRATGWPRSPRRTSSRRSRASRFRTESCRLTPEGVGIATESAIALPAGYWPRRWLLVAGCFAAIFVCYIDRVNISYAILPMSKQYGWDKATQGWVLSSFFVGYLATQFLAGWLAARIGGRTLLGFGVLWWSAFTLLTPLAAEYSFAALIAARIGMGLGEAVAFPSIYQLFGRWIPLHERARAAALNGSGMPLGTIAATLGTPWLVERYGWPSVFYVFGVLGVFWYVYWRYASSERPEDAPRHPAGRARADPREHRAARDAIRRFPGRGSCARRRCGRSSSTTSARTGATT